MSVNTPSQDIRASGIVLRRTNYGEADRILNIITPVGKITAIAKGVRKARSKLAGGVEMFSLIDFNIHKGRSEMGVVTGAKMLEYYGEIVKDFGRMELAGMIFKKIGRLAESSDNSEYFKITEQCLKELNSGMNGEIVEGWFLLNAAKTMGEEMNLYRDVMGNKLVAEERYSWNPSQAAFVVDMRGEYGVDEIKLLRLMSTAELKMIKRVKVEDGMYGKALGLIRIAIHI